MRRQIGRDWTMPLSEIMRTMYADGLEDEKVVMRLTEQQFGGRTEKASKFDDTKRHIDFWWFDNTGKAYGIDVKGIKRNNRHDTNKDATIHWVELKNVRGEKGWVYGDAVYIAFMTSDSVLFVPRKTLAEFVEGMIQYKPIVNVNPKECYIPYQRAGRLDIIVKMPTSDLLKLARHILKRQ